MKSKLLREWFLALLCCAFFGVCGKAQNYNATISGVVTDQSGAAIPAATATLTLASTGAEAHATSGPDGFYAFPNLTPGIYNLKVSAKSFGDYVQSGIELALDQHARQDVQLKVGAASVTTVEVLASSSPLNFENATQSGGISPQTLKELPLLVSGNPRSAIAFAILEPGVTK